MGKIMTLGHLRASAAESKNYIIRRIGNLAGTVVEALDEMDKAKADKPGAVPVTIPKTGWAKDSNAGYPQYYDIAAKGVTANDRAEVTITPGSLAAAKACGLCPTNETLAGKIRIRAASIPAEAITAECWIENGKE